MIDAAFWKAFAEFGLAVAIAGTAFVLMVWYVKITKRETREDTLAKDKVAAQDRASMREDILRMSGRITNQEEFIRDKLLTVVSENSKVLTIFAATFEELNTTIAALNGNLTTHPCLWIQTLRDEERKAIEQIMQKTRSKGADA